MKSILIILTFICQVTTVNAQSNTNKDSCLIDLHTITRKPIGNNKTLVTKRKVANLTAAIKSCSPEYSYPSIYEDHPFSLVIPSFLDEISYGQGNNEFYFSFNDSNNDDSLTCSILVKYDFNDEYKNYCLRDLKNEPGKTRIKTVGSVQLYTFTNAIGFYCGQIFYPNNIVLFYNTSNKKAEEQLQEALTTFR